MLTLFSTSVSNLLLLERRLSTLERSHKANVLGVSINTRQSPVPAARDSPQCLLAMIVFVGTCLSVGFLEQGLVLSLALVGGLSVVR